WNHILPSGSSRVGQFSGLTATSPHAIFKHNLSVTGIVRLQYRRSRLDWTRPWPPGTWRIHESGPGAVDSSDVQCFIGAIGWRQARIRNPEGCCRANQRRGTTEYRHVVWNY